MSHHRNITPLFGPLLVLCLACGDTAAPEPQSPEPTPTAPSGHLWGQVLDRSGICIRGATVEIVQGPGIGRKSGQPEQCDAWAYEGYWFDDLPLGTKVTLRATASGYQPQDLQVRVPDGGYPVQFVLLKK
jgi:hypothetical protein